MHIHDFFLQLMIILLAARFMAELVSRIGIPPVIGELVAGVILGPSILGLIEPAEAIKLLAEIGIILLLFEVGLETDIAKLAETGMKSAVVALAGFLLPFILGFSVSFWLFKVPLLAALFVGGTLTATSIGITVRVLSDLKRQSSREAQIVLGAAVIDDILGVILLGLLYEFSSSGGISASNTGRVILFIAVFLITAPIAAKLISKTIQRLDRVTQIPGLLPTSIVSLLLFFAWIAHAMGAPELLGGFAAGMAVSRYFYMPFIPFLNTDEKFAHRVEEQTRPIIQLFTPIFFVMVGLSLNLRVVDWSSPFIWLLSGSLLLTAVAGKLVSGFLLKGENPKAKWAIGLAMIPRGEVGLIFAELGKTTHVLSDEVYAAMIIVIALTTLLPPFAMRWFYSRYADEMDASLLDDLKISKLAS